MAITKPGWLKDSVAKIDGYYSPKGEKLKSASLTQAHCDEWNGVVKKKKAVKKPKVEEAPVVQEEVVVETADAPGVTTTTVEVEEAPKPKGKKNKGLFGFRKK